MRRVFVPALAAIPLALAISGCSLKQAGINRMASALASSSSVYESDNDPEFVRLAAPSTLKTVEMLLVQAPRHRDLLLTACRGFTEYSYAFLHVEAELRTPEDAAAQDLRKRAAQMYQRARTYCLRGLSASHEAIDVARPAERLDLTTVEDVPFLYWTAASWAAELSVAPDRLLRIAELTNVRALLNRARELDESWDDGAIYEALIALDGLPTLAGGSPAAARADFERARELSHGRSAFAYVTYAGTISDPVEKRKLLEQAVAIDVSATPKRRLTNLIAQRYARAELQRLSGGRPQPRPAGR